MRTLLQKTLTHLAAGILIRLLWFYENSIEIRVYGLENLRMNRRAGLRPTLTLWLFSEFCSSQAVVSSGYRTKTG